MTRQLYEQDTSQSIHRGAICAYRPVFWIEPPLWLLRDIDWHQQQAWLHKWQSRKDAFRGTHIQEEVLANAKVRRVVVLSNDKEIRRLKEYLVAPVYSIDPKRHRSEILEKYRTHRAPHIFYLHRDPNHSEMPESYINLRKIHLLHKGFLSADSKLDLTLTPQAIRMLLQRYKRYLSQE